MKTKQELEKRIEDLKKERRDRLDILNEYHEKQKRQGSSSLNNEENDEYLKAAGDKNVIVW